MNAVSFSSARTDESFPLRCASATQIARRCATNADTHPQLQLVLLTEMVRFLSSRRFTFCASVASRIAAIRRMHRLFILLLLFPPSVSVVAQTPSPALATLRSLLLSELHSTHDKAEWFTPMNNAIAGLTAEQAKWVPKNAQGKLDPNANHSVGMLAYHLVFWNENALARLRAEKPANPNNNDETLMTSTRRIGRTSCSGSISS